MTKRTFIYSILIAVIISTTFSAIITHAITTRNLYNKYGKDNFQHEKQMEAVETPSIGITVQNTVSTDGSQHINITEDSRKSYFILIFQICSKAPFKDCNSNYILAFVEQWGNIKLRSMMTYFRKSTEIPVYI